MEHELLVEPATVAEGLERIAKEIVERDAFDDLHLIGIRQGGEPIAQRLARSLGAVLVCES